MVNILFSLLLSFNIISSPQNKHSCTNLVHVGDSLTSNAYRQHVIDYKKRGFSNVIVSAGGSRSLTNKLPKDDYTGLQAIKHWKSKYPKYTCWVIALGTNDSGYAPPDYAKQIITQAMNIIKNDKVIWVDVWKGTKYNSLNAKTWNNILIKTLSKYPNATVYQWTSYILNKKSLLGPDGVHCTGLGYQKRSQQITLFASQTFF